MAAAAAAAAQQQKMIWVYKDPSMQCLIAKRSPFSHQIHTGHGTWQLLQGAGVPTPVWERVVKQPDGHSYALFEGQVYQITDLLRSHFPSPP
jgi:hypothetical protein